mmetsp:Transcript_4675/g.6923  ORF Transcript_4675/g.6923 Transcript_4675/m.6923 type:complete len:145 (-) Transcript_4675:1233-1667(-)
MMQNNKVSGIGNSSEIQSLLFVFINEKYICSTDIMPHHRQEIDESVCNFKEDCIRSCNHNCFKLAPNSFFVSSVVGTSYEVLVSFCASSLSLLEGLPFHLSAKLLQTTVKTTDCIAFDRSFDSKPLPNSPFHPSTANIWRIASV